MQSQGQEKQETDLESHYRIIRNNNLFRPLGWTAPIKKRRYKLVGTKIDEDGTAWAYMSTDGTRSIMTVFRVGTKVEGSPIKEITSRKVLLENGDVYEQKSVEFLGDEKRRSGRSNRGSTGRAGRSEGKVSESGESKSGADGSAKKADRNDRRSVSSAQRERWQKRIEEFQKSSPEEQARMMEQFRNRGRGRGRR